MTNCGVAVRVRRGVRGRPGGGTADGAEKDLALRRRQLPDVRDDGVEEPVLERREIVGLPVIAGAGGEQRVEGLLPGDVRLDADVFAQGGAELAQRLDERLTLLRVARIDQRERDDLLAVDLLGEERQRRRLAQDGPHGELVRRLGDEFAVLLQHRLRLGDRVHDESAQHVGADRVESELEAGDHAEVAAAASERPEEVGVLGRAGAHHLTGRGHDLGGLEVVDRHAVLATEPAEAPAERQSGDAGGGVDADRRGEAVGLGGGVEVRERGTAFDGDAAPGRVDSRGLHLRKVDHEPVVAQGIAGDVVPAAADGEQEPVVPREVHPADDVRRGGAASDDRGALVDHRVPDLDARCRRHRRSEEESLP